VRAYVMDGVGRLRLSSLPDPPGGPEEVVLETESVSVCSTDVSYFRGQLRPPGWPIVPGHEYVGRVVDVGRRVPGPVRCGDRVSYWGQTDFGGLAGYRVIRPLFPTLPDAVPGARSWHTHRGFTDAHQSAAVVVPEHVDARVATLLEPLTSVLRAIHHSPPAPGDTVVVLGAGPSALLAVQVLDRCFGAGSIIVLDRNRHRLATAGQLGAHLTLDPVADRAQIEELIARHDGSAADQVFDALPTVDEAGAGADVRALGMRLLRPAGTYVVYGATEVPQRLDTWLMLSKGLTLQAAAFDVRAVPMHRTAHLMRVALSLLERSVLQLSTLISQSVDFGDEAAVRAAFTDYGRGGTLKTSVRGPAGDLAPQPAAALPAYVGG
jgi:threonine dehydrogenase-like Zn-dependent dehydrogenase